MNPVNKVRKFYKSLAPHQVDSREVEVAMSVMESGSHMIADLITGTAVDCKTSNLLKYIDAIQLSPQRFDDHVAVSALNERVLKTLSSSPKEINFVVAVKLIESMDPSAYPRLDVPFYYVLQAMKSRTVLSMKQRPWNSKDVKDAMAFLGEHVADLNTMSMSTISAMWDNPVDWTRMDILSALVCNSDPGQWEKLACIPVFGNSGLRSALMSKKWFGVDPLDVSSYQWRQCLVDKRFGEWVPNPVDVWAIGKYKMDVSREIDDALTICQIPPSLVKIVNSCLFWEVVDPVPVSDHGHQPLKSSEEGSSCSSDDDSSSSEASPPLTPKRCREINNNSCFGPSLSISQRPRSRELVKGQRWQRSRSPVKGERYQKRSRSITRRRVPLRSRSRSPVKCKRYQKRSSVSDDSCG